jgi:hypothetical protein
MGVRRRRSGHASTRYLPIPVRDALSCFAFAVCFRLSAQDVPAELIQRIVDGLKGVWSGLTTPGFKIFPYRGFAKGS